MKKQKSYFEAKFNIGQSRGKKLEPDHSGPNGDRLFAATEFLSARQNFILLFSLGGYKARHKEAQLTKQDAHGVEEEDNFLLKIAFITAMIIAHFLTRVFNKNNNVLFIVTTMTFLEPQNMSELGFE